MLYHYFILIFYKDLANKVFTFVLAVIGAPFSNNMSTTASCPDLAAQCNGVKPSLVFDSILAPLSTSSDTIFPLPHFDATCSGVI